MMRNTTVFFAAFLLSQDAFAQTVLFHRDGMGPLPEQYGGSVAGVGDLDGDGFQDLIVGARHRSSVFPGKGRVEVVSGHTGVPILQFEGQAIYDGFGVTVDGLGDATGDGVADVLIGALGTDYAGVESGSVYAFSGADAGLLFRIDGGAGHELGTAIAGIGDVDGDGLGDVVIGDPMWDGPSGVDRGRILVVKGSDGSLIWEVEGAFTRTYLGTYVDAAGDVDGDGTSDVVVGTPEAQVLDNYDHRGRVIVYSGVDGTEILSLFGRDRGDRIGYRVAGLGDLDGDGLSDIAFGQDDDDDVGVIVYSVGAGNVIFRTFSRPFSVAGTGDVNGDGFPDLAVGERHATYGQFRVISGLDGGELMRVVGDGGSDYLGYSVSSIGDFNGDGIFDVLVGAPERGVEPYGSGPGYVRVYTAFDCNSSNYCTTNANSAGTLATIGIDGSTSVTLNDLALTVHGGMPGESALFAYGSEQDQVPLGGGFRCLGGTVFRLSQAILLDSGGDGNLTFDLTATPPLVPGYISPGSTWYFQCYYRDPAAGGAGFTTTDGIAVTFCH